MKKLILPAIVSLIVSAIGWGFSWLSSLSNRVEAHEKYIAVDTEEKIALRKDITDIKSYQKATLCILGEKSQCLVK